MTINEEFSRRIVVNEIVDMIPKIGPEFLFEQDLIENYTYIKANLLDFIQSIYMANLAIQGSLIEYIVIYDLDNEFDFKLFVDNEEAMIDDYFRRLTIFELIDVIYYNQKNRHNMFNEKNSKKIVCKLIRLMMDELNTYSIFRLEKILQYIRIYTSSKTNLRQHLNDDNPGQYIRSKQRYNAAFSIIHNLITERSIYGDTDYSEESLEMEYFDEGEEINEINEIKEIEEIEEINEINEINEIEADEINSLLEKDLRSLVGPVF
jgi:hypothetical protein